MTEPDFLNKQQQQQQKNPILQFFGLQMTQNGPKLKFFKFYEKSTRGVLHEVRDRLQISPQLLSEFNRIN